MQKDPLALQLAILRWLSKGLRFGSPIFYLESQARAERLKVTREEIISELDYLRDPTNQAKAQLVEIPEGALGGDGRLWRLTAAGRDYLRGRNQ